MAYKLTLLGNSRLHPNFNVSKLKKQVGIDQVQSELPILDPTGCISKEPLKILDRRIEKKGQRAVIEVLVEWTNSFPKNAT
ncbi:hypothetical protein HRI_001654200 [Hibiscus trionum]|uniref:Uncharacterized protein n=1 Tax=Hibiscus trionum TaxID=183268 RepID=A0A9W7LWM8_HIBTR|nr:hypothetical protein HRI_001654200 [Hibiscus trionum]